MGDFYCYTSRPFCVVCCLQCMTSSILEDLLHEVRFTEVIRILTMYGILEEMISEST
jgi:hypothetical protein